MDDKFLKTIIFIIKDTETNEPVVITHFKGFRDKSDAEDFSMYLKQQFTIESDYDNSNKTIH